MLAGCAPARYTPSAAVGVTFGTSTPWRLQKANESVLDRFVGAAAGAAAGTAAMAFSSCALMIDSYRACGRSASGGVGGGTFGLPSWGGGVVSGNGSDCTGGVDWIGSTCVRSV